MGVSLKSRSRNNRSNAIASPPNKGPCSSCYRSLLCVQESRYCRRQGNSLGRHLEPHDRSTPGSFPFERPLGLQQWSGQVGPSEREPDASTFRAPFVGLAHGLRLRREGAFTLKAIRTLMACRFAAYPTDLILPNSAMKSLPRHTNPRCPCLC